MKAGQKSIYILICILLLELTGCAINSEKETYHPKPKMNRQNLSEETEIAVVMQGDLTDEKTISLSAKPAAEYSLGFSVSGVNFDTFYVKEGDAVKKGQILARLSCEEYIQQKKRAEYELERVKIQLSKQKALFDQYAMSKTEYERKVADLTNQQQYLSEQIRELDIQIKDRSIISNIDGYVKSISPIDSSATSVEGSKVISLVGGETSLTAKATDTAGLTVGNHYQMNTSMQSYELVLLSIEEDAPHQYILTFLCTDQDYDAASGEAGKITYTAYELKNVLYVDQRAVSQVGNTSYVYYMENGNRQAKEVTTGPLINGSYVILKGVSKGEELLCD